EAAVLAERVVTRVPELREGLGGRAAVVVQAEQRRARNRSAQRRRHKDDDGRKNHVRTQPLCHSLYSPESCRGLIVVDPPSGASLRRGISIPRTSVPRVSRVTTKARKRSSS